MTSKLWLSVVVFAVGCSGAMGKPGLPGPAGPDGKAGMDGANGVDGTPGMMGAKGDPGPRGPVGIGSLSVVDNLAHNYGVLVSSNAGVVVYLDAMSRKWKLQSTGATGGITYGDGGGFFYTTKDCTGTPYTQGDLGIHNVVSVDENGEAWLSSGVVTTTVLASTKGRGQACNTGVLIPGAPVSALADIGVAPVISATVQWVDFQ